MCNEAREELRVRLKLVVLEFANQFGVTKTARNSTSPVHHFTVGNRDTRMKADLGCIERNLSHTVIPERHHRRLLRKSWNYGKIIK